MVLSALENTSLAGGSQRPCWLLAERPRAELAPGIKLHPPLEVARAAGEGCALKGDGAVQLLLRDLTCFPGEKFSRGERFHLFL